MEEKAYLYTVRWAVQEPPVLLQFIDDTLLFLSLISKNLASKSLFCLLPIPETLKYSKEQQGRYPPYIGSFQSFYGI